MTPRTRSTNKDANYTAYYSKKVPQQIRFPHRGKTVRRPSMPTKDGSDKRQMKFLPEKMRIKGSIFGQSDDDEDEDVEGDMEDGGVAIGLDMDEGDEQQSTAQVTKGRGKKRSSGAMHADTGDEEDPVRPTPKRRRKTAEPKQKRRSRQIKAESEEEDHTAPTAGARKVDKIRTLRRQSTMTQLVEGRRPTSDAEEPEFKPLKRSPRVSWSGQGKIGKDKKQRTLTQMVRGWGPTEIVSDDDMEETLSDAETEDNDSQGYGHAIAVRLAQEGLLQNKSDDVEKVVEEQAGPDIQTSVETVHDNDTELLDASSLVVQSLEDDVDDYEEDSYEPTQFIEAPVTRTRRSTRRSSGKKDQVHQAVQVSRSTLQRNCKSGFGLLSTPEKRRVRVIPSSQSPTESPLSSQASPQKIVRSPLQERSANTIQAAETPSKRKQVTFKELPQEQRPPPSLKKFKSVIQDSEDEEDDLIEEDARDQRQRVGAHTQVLTCGIDDRIDGEAIGADTQAMVDQIDLACTIVNEDAARHDRNSSEKLSVPNVSRNANEPSPELGERPTQSKDAQEEVAPESYSPYRTAYAGVKQESLHDDVDIADLSLPGEHHSASNEPLDTEDELPPTQEQIPSSPPLIQQLVEDTCPSTPMVIMDDSSNEEDEPDPTPPSTARRPLPQPSSTSLQQSADLDGELIQVPRSPSARNQTQQSHSSKAEQQLQSEWLSFSQYVGVRPPQPSSMTVGHDKFSYHATPLPPRNPTAPQPSGYYMSQATTVDEVTPKKNRTQRIISANTTPHKTASSQPTISPIKPPPLFIPSSFPSPAKARIEEWSSPVLARTQDIYGASRACGSVEDFSIPLPPPIDAEDDCADGV